MAPTSTRLQTLPPAGTEEPTVGEIKRALHALTRATAGLTRREGRAVLGEVHDLLRQLAHSNGIDPDEALHRRRAAASSLRAQLVLASATASDRTAG